MVYLLQSGDTGAPTLSGTAGDLTTLLNKVLVVNSVYTTPDDSAFTDRATEARLSGGTAFNLLPSGVTNDHLYIGWQQAFNQTRFTLTQVGIGGVYVIEYWNGTAWTTITPLADGTSGFTASGLINWTLPTNWVANSVNSVTLFWLRVRASSAPSQIPTVDCLSIMDWQVAFSGTNQFAYRANTGNRLFINVNDNGPGAGTGQEARIVGYENMSAIATAAVGWPGLFPTATQLANGLFVRKSATLNATTRTWIIVGDGRTFYMFVLTGDSAGLYLGWAFGEFYSIMPVTDSYNTMIIGRITENSGTTTSAAPECLPSIVASPASIVAGHYIARQFYQTGGSNNNSLHCVDQGPNQSTTTMGTTGVCPFPNPVDGKLYLSRLRISETASGNLRGFMRGMYNFQHAVANINDGNQFAGSGDLVGKTFVVIKSSGSSGLYTMEISNTWDTN